MYDTPIVWPRDMMTMHYVHRSHRKFPFALIPTQHGFVPLSPLADDYASSMSRVPHRSHLKPRVASCAGIAMERHVRYMPNMAIHVMSHSVHRSHDKYLVLSFLCCRPAVLRVVIIYPYCRIRSNVIFFSLRSGELCTKTQLWPIRHWGGESLFNPS